MPLTAKQMSELRSLAQPYLEEDEKILTGVFAWIRPGFWPRFLFGWVPFVGSAVFRTTYWTTYWQVVLTDRRIIALSAGFRGRPSGEMRAVPWSDVARTHLGIDLLSFGLAHVLRVTTVYGENLRYIVQRFQGFRRADVAGLRAVLAERVPSYLGRDARGARLNNLHR